jgi:hypothetical protein
MKIMKKALSIIFILAILFSMMGVTALAAVTHTVTINSETAGHTYQAYQVFAGNYTDSNKSLSNIT